MCFEKKIYRVFPEFHVFSYFAKHGYTAEYWYDYSIDKIIKYSIYGALHDSSQFFVWSLTVGD